jgi:hypothetical protein
MEKPDFNHEYKYPRGELEFPYQGGPTGDYVRNGEQRIRKSRK